MLCVLWNHWASDSVEDVNIFSLCHCYIHLESGVALYLNKLEFFLLICALCQVCLELVLGSGEKDFYESSINIHYVTLIYP